MPISIVFCEFALVCLGFWSRGVGCILLGSSLCCSGERCSPFGCARRCDYRFGGCLSSCTRFFDGSGYYFDVGHGNLSNTGRC